jgi:hypothetical protein
MQVTEGVSPGGVLKSAYPTVLQFAETGNFFVNADASTMVIPNEECGPRRHDRIAVRTESSKRVLAAETRFRTCIAQAQTDAARDLPGTSARARTARFAAG